MQEEQKQTAITNLISCQGIDMVPLSYHTAVVYKDEMICFGGRIKGTTFSKSVYSLNMKSFEWSELEIKGEIPKGKLEPNLNILKEEVTTAPFSGTTKW
jgi:hypothetical protein